MRASTGNGERSASVWAAKQRLLQAALRRKAACAREWLEKAGKRAAIRESGDIAQATGRNAAAERAAQESGGRPAAMRRAKASACAERARAMECGGRRASVRKAKGAV